MSKAQPPDLLLQVFKEVLLVDGHPRLIVLVGNGFLEVLISTLVKHKLKRGAKITTDHRTYSYAVQLTLLYEAGHLTEKEFTTLDWYRGIRNRAAHEPIFRVETSDFTALGNPAYPENSSLARLTTDLLGSIWNKHHELFSPLFGDTASARKREATRSDAVRPTRLSSGPATARHT